MKRLFCQLPVILMLLTTGSFAFAQPTTNEPQVIPGRCEEDRFYVTPTTATGKTLRFFTDTGGGFFITGETARRLKLSETKVVVDGKKTTYAKLPDWQPGAGIPSVAWTEDELPLLTKADSEVNGALYRNIDGLLGAGWFRERVWTFDYPTGRLLLRALRDVPAHDFAHEVSLGFQVNGDTRKKTSNFPRITVRIDGQDIDLLLDTGASTELTAAAQKELDDNRPALRATSFITATIFDRWHDAHPDWRVIKNAEKHTGSAMIEVPQVEVAGFKTGPVWFTRRADGNFRQWMSQWMDQPIDGSLGGNAMRQFRVTVDYPNALAVFEEPGH